MHKYDEEIKSRYDFTARKASHAHSLLVIPPF